jgi:hypothetical protein
MDGDLIGSQTKVDERLDRTWLHDRVGVEQLELPRWFMPSDGLGKNCVATADKVSVGV